MPNGTYGGVRGKKTKVGQKTFVSRPTRFLVADGLAVDFYHCCDEVENLVGVTDLIVVP